MQDDEIVPFLHQHRRSTFFTRDLGWHERTLCHSRYCLVCLTVEKEEAAVFVRRVLRHGELNTQAKRMGAVVRVSPTGLRVWRLNAEEENLS